MALATYVQVGILATNTKSFAYDSSAYVQADPASITLANTVNGAPGTLAGTAAAYIPAFTGKQLRSLTIVPTVAETAADFISLDLYSVYPQAFGTATGTTILGTGFSGTVLGTGINRYRITGIVGAGGTGVGGATGTQAIGLGTFAAFNPTYIPLCGATATITAIGPGGTNVQAGYVFPVGANGGLTMNPGDVLVVARGTASIGVLAIEAELSFTPGANFTR